MRIEIGESLGKVDGVVLFRKGTHHGKNGGANSGKLGVYGTGKIHLL
jgi:hypothetical protein